MIFFGRTFSPIDLPRIDQRSSVDVQRLVENLSKRKLPTFAKTFSSSRETFEPEFHSADFDNRPRVECRDVIDPSVFCRKTTFSTVRFCFSTGFSSNCQLLLELQHETVDFEIETDFLSVSNLRSSLDWTNSKCRFDFEHLYESEYVPEKTIKYWSS